MEHSNVHEGSLDLFQQNWQAYRSILEHDLMEHRSLTAVLEREMWRQLEGVGQPSPHSQSDLEGVASLADLGCGDLALLAPLYRSLPLERFTGVDAAAAVLGLAAEALGPVAYPCSWEHEDLLRWSRREGAERYRLVVCCFALHHLHDADKEAFLAALPARLLPGGVVLLADMFRHSGESLESHMARSLERITGWGEIIGKEQATRIHAHVSSSDLPAEQEAFQTMAERQGWQGTWLWCDEAALEGLIRLERAS